MTESACPAAETLVDYLLGKLSDETVDAISSHAAGCECCQETLAQLRGHDDMLIHRLRTAVPENGYEQELACQGAIQAIVAMAYSADSLAGFSRGDSAAPAEFSAIDLATLVRRFGPLQPADACELIRQAAMALDEAHQFGLARLEVHPAHLLLTADGEVKVLDLGLELTSTCGATDEPTSLGAVLGTLDYMAPEQTRDSRRFDVRADIYRLGATLYKLLTGHAPFDDPRFRSPVKKLMALANEMPPPVSDFRSDMPSGLADVLERLLAKKPEDRYENPTLAAEALEPFAGEANIRAVIESVRRGGDRSTTQIRS